MSVINFPPAGIPQMTKFVMLADEYPKVTGPPFTDGGRDSFLGAATPVRRWEVMAEGLLAAEAALYDAQYDSTYGGHLGCTLTWKDGTVYANVKIESYERGHSSRYATTQFRKIKFVKYP